MPQMPSRSRDQLSQEMGMRISINQFSVSDERAVRRQSRHPVGVRGVFLDEGAIAIVVGRRRGSTRRRALARLRRLWFHRFRTGLRRAAA
eukprot:6321636-Pyramimonas_sp.AAC.1